MRDRAGAGDPRVPAITPVAGGRLRLDIRLSGTGPRGNAEHVAIVGATQCGKSTIAHALVRTSRNLIIADVGDKGQYDHLGHVTSDPEELVRYPVVIWKPSRRDVDRPAKDYSDPWSRGLWYIRTVRRAGGLTFVHDEPEATLPVRPHEWAAEMLDNGAGHGLGVITLPHSFSGVYPRALDGATHYFFLRLGNASQRGNLASSLGVQGLNLARLPNHQFYYWRTGWIDAVGPYSTDSLGPRPPR